MARPQSRRSLGVLFALLALCFAGLTAYAVTGSAWIVAAAAGILCLWLAELAYRQLR